MKNYMVNDMADEMTQHEYSNNRYYAPLHFLYIYIYKRRIPIIFCGSVTRI